MRIVRRKHADIYLWGSCDGHWAEYGVGTTICEEVHKLLAEMTQAQLCEAIEALRVAYKDDEVYDKTLYRGKTFQFTELANVVCNALGALAVPPAPVAAAAAAAPAASAACAMSCGTTSATTWSTRTPWTRTRAC